MIFRPNVVFFQNEPGNGDQRKSEVDQNIVLEKDGADNGNVRQTGDINGLEGGDLGGQRPDTENQAIDIGSQTTGQNIHADTGNHLIGAHGDTEPGHYQAVQHTAQNTGGQSQPQIVGGAGHGETRDGAHQHGTLHAQIQNTGALGIKLPPVYTVEQAADAIMALKGGGANA